MIYNPTLWCHPEELGSILSLKIPSSRHCHLLLGHQGSKLVLTLAFFFIRYNQRGVNAVFYPGEHIPGYRKCDRLRTDHAIVSAVLL